MNHPINTEDSKLSYSYILTNQVLEWGTVLVTSYMSTDHSAPNANPETNRPTPNYHPSIWGNRFIMTNTPDDEGDFVISVVCITRS